uniref:Small ribosomal subunit protein uS3m n=1 Tax=Tilletia indica TaxID=43049 RepID=A0A1L6Z773_9BASI|nr:ribosomal protein S3 [Tilletia indica]
MNSSFSLFSLKERAIIDEHKSNKSIKSSEHIKNRNNYDVEISNYQCGIMKIENNVIKVIDSYFNGISIFNGNSNINTNSSITSIRRFISKPTFQYYNNEIKIILYYYLEDDSLINTVTSKYYNTKEGSDAISYNDISFNDKNNINNKNTTPFNCYKNFEVQSKKTNSIFFDSNLQSLISTIEQIYNENKRSIISMESSNNKNMKKMINDLESTSLIGTSFHNKKITLQCSRIYYPYMNRDILAKYIAHNCSSNTFLNIQEIISNRVRHSDDITQIHQSQLRNMFIKKRNEYTSFLTSMITGIKVKISGRLTTESIIPRVTVKSFQTGTFNQKINKNLKYLNINNKLPISNINSFKSLASQINYSKPNFKTINTSEYTTKNRIGAFTVKVWISSTR